MKTTLIYAALCLFSLPAFAQSEEMLIPHQQIARQITMAICICKRIPNRAVNMVYAKSQRLKLMRNGVFIAKT